jgi:hypothetical protein
MYVTAGNLEKGHSFNKYICLHKLHLGLSSFNGQRYVHEKRWMRLRCEDSTFTLQGGSPARVHHGDQGETRGIL